MNDIEINRDRIYGLGYLTIRIKFLCEDFRQIIYVFTQLVGE